MKIKLFISLLVFTSINHFYSQIITSTYIGAACSFPFFKNNSAHHYSQYQNFRNIPSIGGKIKEEIKFLPKTSARIGVELISSRVWFESPAGTGNNAQIQAYDEQNYLHKLNILEVHIPLEIKQDIIDFEKFSIYGIAGLGYRSTFWSHGELLTLNNDKLYSDKVLIENDNFNIFSRKQWPSELVTKAIFGLDFNRRKELLGLYCELEYSYFSGFYKYFGSQKKLWYTDSGVFNNHLIEVVIGVKISQEK